MNWDFYQCLVNDKPASISLDLDFMHLAPLADYPELFYLRIPMCQPRDDGLSSQQEFDTLAQMEDAVVEVLTATNQMLYVGRLTSDGHRDLFFYSRDTQINEAALEHCLNDFPDYAWQGGVNADPEWEAYIQLLMPSDEQFERMKNRSVCDALAEQGDKFTTERDIMHWAYFRTQNAADNYATFAQSSGYKLEEVETMDDTDEPFFVRVSIRGIPDYSEIDALTLPLFHAAKNEGGRYDGWECELIH